MRNSAFQTSTFADQILFAIWYNLYSPRNGITFLCTPGNYRELLKADFANGDGEIYRSNFRWTERDRFFRQTFKFEPVFFFNLQLNFLVGLEVVVYR